MLASRGLSGPRLLVFFLLTYVVAWSVFITVAIVSSARSPVGALAVTLAAYTPSVVALWLTSRTEGRRGVNVLLSRLIPTQVGARWYVFALLYTVTIKLVVAVVLRVWTGVWPRFGTEPLYLIPLAVAISTPFQAGEEIGWRGYALPRLAARFGLPFASVLLGVIWAAWHLPLFFLVGADTQGQSFVVYLLIVTALSVAMAWLYGNANGCLLPVMLLHATANNTKDIVPSVSPGATSVWGLAASPVAWLTAAGLWIGASWFLARMPAAERIQRRAPGETDSDGESRLTPNEAGGNDPPARSGT